MLKGKRKFGGKENLGEKRKKNWDVVRGDLG